MGSNNDVILNSGTIAASSESATAGSINLGGGNDLILNRGKFDINESSFIDGGEPLALGSKPMQGLNVFMQGYNESRSDGQSSGLDQSQLVNFAAIKLEHDGPWYFPYGKNCQVGDKSRVIRRFTRCVGLIGRRGIDQQLVITDDAPLEAGVIALGPGVNTIHVEHGSLRSVLVDSDGDDNIVLGERFLGANGELIVGAMDGVASITQLGGVWSYANDATEDGFGVFPSTTAAGTLVVKETALNRQVQGSPVVSKATFQRIDGGQNDLGIQVGVNASLAVIDGIHGDQTSLTTRGDVRLSGVSTYRGETTIKDGAILYAENRSALSDQSPFVISEGGRLNLQGFDQTISSLNGGGDLVLNAELSATDASTGGLNGSDLVINSGDYAGSILDGDYSGIGSITKATDGDLTLSGVNDYVSPTFIRDGRLIAASSTALSPNSAFALSDSGTLDLVTSLRKGEFRFEGNDSHSAYLERLRIGGQAKLLVSSIAPLRIKGQLEFNQGEIAAFLDSGVNSKAPIQMTKTASSFMEILQILIPQIFIWLSLMKCAKTGTECDRW